MRLVAEPINTSPLAPTYSEADEVDMVRVVVTERLQVEALSPWVVTFKPAEAS